MGFPLFTLIVAVYVAVAASVASAGKVTNPKNIPKDAILLSNVESLTFRAGKMTASRRIAPVQQLNCVGPRDICKLHNVDVMRCTNEGADYDAENIQWACRADLPEEFKLGSTDVACEGYASSDDPYVLKGSCGVDYRLVLTDKGEVKYGTHHGFPSFDREETTSNLAKFVFIIIFAGVLLIILSRMLEACRRNPPRLGGGDTGRPPWYGGGGDDDNNNDDDPPPPYDSYRPNPPKKQRAYRTQSGSSNAGSSTNAGQQQNQGWRPGPWTAGLAGAGLGYALGRGQNRTQTQPGYNTQRPSRGFFGGGGDAGPSNTRSSPSPPTFSSSRYESTGFGGTSRR